MDRKPRHELHPWWRRRSIVIPPETREEWLRLAAWEIWAGVVLVILVGIGAQLIATSPDRIIAVLDLSRCYGEPPIPQPCDRMLYRGGALNVAFSALSGFMMVAVAAWILWGLWNLAEPRPMADDFLRLLHESFGRSWRNPLTWPWARVLWAYGFTTVGAALTAGLAIAVWSLVTPEPRPLSPKVGTSQSFRPSP
jgi:hypothetical protein